MKINNLEAPLAVMLVFIISILFAISQTNLKLSKLKRKQKVIINSKILSSAYKKPGELEVMTSDGILAYLPLVKNVDACQKGNSLNALVKVYPNNFKFINSFSLWVYLNLFKGVKARAWADVDFNCYGKYSKVEHVKLFFEKLTNKIEDSDAITLLFAVNLGQKDLVGKNLKELFRTLGLSHFLVVSGFHVGLFFTSLFFILDYLISRFTFLLKHIPSEYLSSPISILMTWSYASLTGFALPTLRAVIFLSIVVFYRFLNIKVSALHKLFLAASIIMFIWPSSFYEVGFILSFFAVLGVLVGLELSGFFNGALNQKLVFSFLSNSFFICFAAWLFTLPIVILFFNQVNFFSVAFNFFLIPILTLLLCYLGMPALGLAYLGNLYGIKALNLILNNLIQYLWCLYELVLDYRYELEFANAIFVSIVILLFNCLFFLSLSYLNRKKKEQFSMLASNISY